MGAKKNIASETNERCRAGDRKSRESTQEILGVTSSPKNMASETNERCRTDDRKRRGSTQEGFGVTSSPKEHGKRNKRKVPHRPQEEK